MYVMNSSIVSADVPSIPRWSNPTTVALSRTSRATRLGRIAAVMHPVMPPSETAMIVGRSRPAASMSAVTCSTRASTGGVWSSGSEAPVPGLSYIATRAKRPSSVSHARGSGYCQKRSMCETQPGIRRISAGPSPNTCQAMLTPSCSRYRVSGISIQTQYLLPGRVKQAAPQIVALVGEREPLVGHQEDQDGGERPEERQGGDLAVQRQQREADDGRDRALPVEGVDVAPAERHVGEEVE